METHNFFNVIKKKHDRFQSNGVPIAMYLDKMCHNLQTCLHHCLFKGEKSSKGDRCLSQNLEKSLFSEEKQMLTIFWLRTERQSVLRQGDS
jgi:hypothetical protein